MTRINGCQIPCYPRIEEGEIDVPPQPYTYRIKRHFARPWNYWLKPRLKRLIKFFKKMFARKKHIAAGKGAASAPVATFNPGDLVLVRSRAEIEATLDTFKELRGCAFLEYMWIFCGTEQRVLHPLERFLDERDYKVKRSNGIVLLEGVLCRGTPVFGKCDRACHLFWRVEWLEKI